MLVAPTQTPITAAAGQLRATTGGGRHRAVPVRSIGDRGRWVRLGVAAGLTALVVPVAGLMVPMISSDPSVMAQASATPKPGSAGGNHSKPGDNKKKKKTDNKKSNNNRQGSSARGSSSDSGAQRSGSSFSEQTNANNRWSADGANRSVNTRISSQAQPPQPAQAPSQAINANPSQGQQNPSQSAPQQAATPPPQATTPDTPPAQTTTPPAAQSTQPAAATPATTPSSPSNPVGPATALVVGAAAVAASRRRSSTGAPSTPTNPADNWDHGTLAQSGQLWDLHGAPQTPPTQAPSAVTVTPDVLAVAQLNPASAPGSSIPGTSTASVVAAPLVPASSPVQGPSPAAGINEMMTPTLAAPPTMGPVAVDPLNMLAGAAPPPAAAAAAAGASSSPAAIAPGCGVDDWSKAVAEVGGGPIAILTAAPEGATGVGIPIALSQIALGFASTVDGVQIIERCTP